jgi:hypothetical protein
MIYARLSNPVRPDLPPVIVSFPIEENPYEKLSSIGIGSATERDCYVAEIDGDVPILKRLEKVTLNVDELDYLAKRLENFDKGELAQFQGVAVSRGYFDMTDFINLTFCCHCATVIQDFSDLNAIGRDHFLSIYGRSATEKMKAVDFRKNAISLIMSDSGKVTPYGVVYDNGMCLERRYDGLHFPEYQYSRNNVLTVKISDKTIPEIDAPVTWLYLPMEECQIERAIQRAGIAADNIRLRLQESRLPLNLNGLLAEDSGNLREWNELSSVIQEARKDDPRKIIAVTQMVIPHDITEARHLLEQIDLFDFIPGIDTPEEYGQYMILESGHFEHDNNLVEFYDYEKYGQWRMSQEQGKFVDDGYVSYHGFVSIDEVLAGNQSERLEMTMGGM